ncbi:unnamed protein product, partial [Symbiodinium sp. KB8]
MPKETLELSDTLEASKFDVPIHSDAEEALREELRGLRLRLSQQVSGRCRCGEAIASKKEEAMGTLAVQLQQLLSDEKKTNEQLQGQNTNLRLQILALEDTLTATAELAGESLSKAAHEGTLTSLLRSRGAIPEVLQREGGRKAMEAVSRLEDTGIATPSFGGSISAVPYSPSGLGIPLKGPDFGDTREANTQKHTKVRGGKERQQGAALDEENEKAEEEEGTYGEELDGTEGATVLAAALMGVAANGVDGSAGESGSREGGAAVEERIIGDAAEGGGEGEALRSASALSRPSSTGGDSLLELSGRQGSSSKKLSVSLAALRLAVIHERRRREAAEAKARAAMSLAKRSEETLTDIRSRFNASLKLNQDLRQRLEKAQAAAEHSFQRDEDTSALVGAYSDRCVALMKELEAARSDMQKAFKSLHEKETVAEHQEAAISNLKETLKSVEGKEAALRSALEEGKGREEVRGPLTTVAVAAVLCSHCPADFAFPQTLTLELRAAEASVESLTSKLQAAEEELNKAQRNIQEMTRESAKKAGALEAAKELKEDAAELKAAAEALRSEKAQGEERLREVTSALEAERVERKA